VVPLPFNPDTIMTTPSSKSRWKTAVLATIPLIVACASDVTSPAPLVETGIDVGPSLPRHQFASAAAIQVNWATFQHTRDGYNETASFQDIAGNSYSFSSQYDWLGRLRTFEIRYNSERIVHDFSWSSPNTISIAQTRAVGFYWVNTDVFGTPSADGFYPTSGGDPGGPGCDRDCMPESLQLMSVEYVGEFDSLAWGVCRMERARVAVSVAGVFGSALAFGGSVAQFGNPALAPAAPWMAAGSAVLLSGAALDFGISMAQLRECKRQVAPG